MNEVNIINKCFIIYCFISATIPFSRAELKAPEECGDTISTCMLWKDVCQFNEYQSLMLKHCKMTCRICLNQEK